MRCSTFLLEKLCLLPSICDTVKMWLVQYFYTRTDGFIKRMIHTFLKYKKAKPSIVFLVFLLLTVMSNCNKWQQIYFRVYVLFTNI